LTVTHFREGLPVPVEPSRGYVEYELKQSRNISGTSWNSALGLVTKTKQYQHTISSRLQFSGGQDDKGFDSGRIINTSHLRDTSEQIEVVTEPQTEEGVRQTPETWTRTQGKFENWERMQDGRHLERDAPGEEKGNFPRSAHAATCWGALGVQSNPIRLLRSGGRRSQNLKGSRKFLEPGFGLGSFSTRGLPVLPNRYGRPWKSGQLIR